MSSTRHESYKIHNIYILTLLLVCVAPATGTMVVDVSDIGGAYGTTVDIPINVSGALGVGAMDISMMYDSTKLSPTGIVTTGGVTAGALVITDATIYGDPSTISEDDNLTLMQYGALANNTATDGVVNISILCDGSNPPVGFNGAGSVAMVEFMVTGTGSSQLNLSVAAYNVSAPYNSSGYVPDAVNITDGYEVIHTTIENGTFTVTSGGTKGDFDNEGDVDFDDFVEFAGAYGVTTCADPNYNSIADFDNDGDVDFDDFVEFAGIYTD